MQAELELGHHAEVAAAAAQAPEQLGVLALARAHRLPVGGDQVGRDQVVAGQAVLAHQPADAAAEREPGDAGGGDEAAGRGQAEGLGLGVELAPGEAALGPHGARLGVDPDALHRREVDHQAAVAGGVAGHVVAAAAHGDGQALAAGEADRGDDVARARCSARSAPAGGRSCRSRRCAPRRRRRRRAARARPAAASRSSCTVASPRAGGSDNVGRWSCPLRRWSVCPGRNLGRPRYSAVSAAFALARERLLAEARADLVADVRERIAAPAEALRRHGRDRPARRRARPAPAGSARTSRCSGRSPRHMRERPLLQLARLAGRPASAAMYPSCMTAAAAPRPVVGAVEQRERPLRARLAPGPGRRRARPLPRSRAATARSRVRR